VNPCIHGRKTLASRRIHDRKVYYPLVIFQTPPFESQSPKGGSRKKIVLVILTASAPRLWENFVPLDENHRWEERNS